ncbi:MAG: hypothetical protein SGCHY_001599 [Lobulomycetales sp.]
MAWGSKLLQKLNPFKWFRGSKSKDAQEDGQTTQDQAAAAPSVVDEPAPEFAQPPQHLSSPAPAITTASSLQSLAPHTSPVPQTSLAPPPVQAQPNTQPPRERVASVRDTSAAAPKPSVAAPEQSTPLDVSTKLPADARIIDPAGNISEPIHSDAAGSNGNNVVGTIDRTNDGLAAIISGSPAANKNSAAPILFVVLSLCAALAFVLLGIFFFFRQKRRRQRPSASKQRNNKVVFVRAGAFQPDGAAPSSQQPARPIKLKRKPVNYSGKDECRDVQRLDLEKGPRISIMHECCKDLVAREPWIRDVLQDGFLSRRLSKEEDSDVLE